MESLNENSDRRCLVDVRVGEDVRIHAFVNAYGCSIGNQTRVGTFVEIQRGVTIGARCKIQSHTFICEGVEIEDEVFIGHGVMFTNDRYPRSVNASGGPATTNDWILERTVIKRGTAIGSNATILCGVTIGENAIIGAGSVVVKDVPPGVTVAGNPARPLRRLKEE